LVKCELKRCCEGCRGILIVEEGDKITEVKTDGRRVLSIVCPACGEVNEFLRVLNVLKTRKEEVWTK